MPFHRRRRHCTGHPPRRIKLAAHPAQGGPVGITLVAAKQLPATSPGWNATLGSKQPSSAAHFVVLVTLLSLLFSHTLFFLRKLPKTKHHDSPATLLSQHFSSLRDLREPANRQISLSILLSHRPCLIPPPHLLYSRRPPLLALLPSFANRPNRTHTAPHLTISNPLPPPTFVSNPLVINDSSLQS